MPPNRALVGGEIVDQALEVIAHAHDPGVPYGGYQGEGLLRHHRAVAGGEGAVEVEILGVERSHRRTVAEPR